MRWIARLLIGVGALGLLSCAPRPTPTPTARPAGEALDRVAPPVSAITAEPMIRVRVAVRRPHVRLDAGTLRVGPGPEDEGRSQPRRFTGPVTISRASGAWLVADASGTTLRWALPTLAAEAMESGGPIGMNGAVYPGRLVFRAAAGHSDQIDVINHVGLETYLPGVLERELFPKWHPVAYRAQAIAARSYALVQIARRRDRAWDLESTQASQVYGGRATNPRAIDAVQRTRGQVLTWRGRVVEAFYSSSSGGVSQDAVYAFVDRAGWFEIPPLRGQRHGWGASATYYQWGPVTRDAGTLARRIAAWGQAQGHPVGSLNGLRDVRITHRSSAGRPAQFTVIDGHGRAYVLGCEQFRFAANHDAPGLRSLAAADQLRSSHFDVRMSGRTVQFIGGRGYGHGVGLDQWAAQDMAERGHDETAILATFYHQAQVRKAY